MNFISDVIYHLKNEYGLPLEIYTMVSESIDLETGAKNIVKNRYKIKKAILLPRRLYAEVLPLVSGRQNLNLLDKDRRLIIIDVKDYPKDYIIRKNDYCVTKHERFNIVERELYDDKLAVVLTVSKITGEQTAAIIEMNVKNTIDINQSVSNE